MSKEKVALVTGASSGIGREIAIQLAKNGYLTYIAYTLSEEGAKQTLEAIECFKGKGVIIQADVTSEEQVQNMFSKIEQEQGTLDVLVNNAGIYYYDYIENHDIDRWNAILTTNLTGKMLCTKHAVPLLKKSLFPSVVNIASRAALKPMEESAAYCAAAAGIEMLTKVSALELSQYAIRVNCICPGLTRTRMTEQYDTDEDFQRYADKNPLKRVGEPKDIADAVLFLISDKARFITGDTLQVNGGILLR